MGPIDAETRRLMELWGQLPGKREAEAGTGEADAGGPSSSTSKRSRKKKQDPNYDDPENEQDRYYPDPAYIWWMTENLPHRWRGVRTWGELCEAAWDERAQTVCCFAEDCDREWPVGPDRDRSSCIMSMWSHMESCCEKEKEKSYEWHPNESMMKQFLACYKREQLADLERKRAEESGKGSGKDAGATEATAVAGAAGPSDAGKGKTKGPTGKDVEQAVKVSGWASRGGWGGSATPRF